MIEYQFFFKCSTAKYYYTHDSLTTYKNTYRPCLPLTLRVAIPENSIAGNWNESQ